MLGWTFTDFFSLRTRSPRQRKSCWWLSSSTWRRRWFAFGSATVDRRKSASTRPAAPPLLYPARLHLSWRTKPPATAHTWYHPPAWIPFHRFESKLCYFRHWPDILFDARWNFSLSSYSMSRYRVRVCPRSPPASAQQVSSNYFVSQFWAQSLVRERLNCSWHIYKTPICPCCYWLLLIWWNTEESSLKKWFLRQKVRSRKQWSFIDITVAVQQLFASMTHLGDI